ncbi:conserved hypothetical protein [Rhodococcus sp. RD6.2]|uniref:DUF6319 family protein n=1 Tax=Rhodococcus sp. RD6.2 TaxID=260936 RepID=UPI00063B2893|nr:translation initiation factor [Rhodococcus sp. RD6.2]CRK50750.1 conserved hypothetical protein [Rhodococcus sp. RD6.2]
MPPRSRLGDRLTEQNLTDLAAAIADGKRATVYLNDATPSLGLPAGCSAKVVSVDGTTVLIRPKGVNDELPFEADELRMTRNPSQPAAKPAPAPKPAAPPARPRSAAAQAALDRSAASAPKPVSPQPKPLPTSPKDAVTTPTPDAATAPAPKRPRRTKEPVGVSVTLHAEAGGEWTVTVTHGAKRPGKAAPVSADSVERAVHELGDPAAEEAVASVLSAAREAAAKRVEELSKQLDEARSALESLGS